MLAVETLYAADECENYNSDHPEWIFCDDFESSDPLVGPGRYFEYGDNDGDCKVVENVGVLASRGVEVIWQQGEVGAGERRQVAEYRLQRCQREARQHAHDESRRRLAPSAGRPPASGIRGSDLLRQEAAHGFPTGSNPVEDPLDRSGRVDRTGLWEWAFVEVGDGKRAGS